MATLTIPTRNDIFHYMQSVELEGDIYMMTFTYNKRMDCWHLAIGEEQDEVAGIRLVGGIDILKQYHHLDVPPGELRCIDLDKRNREPDRTIFGDRVVLQYTESAS